MSADNWAICPQCANKHARDLEEEETRTAASYGKVSPDEFLAATTRDRERRAAELEETLREDFSIGINNDTLEFHVSYRSVCATCGFAYEFQELRDIKIATSSSAAKRKRLKK